MTVLAAPGAAFGRPLGAGAVLRNFVDLLGPDPVPDPRSEGAATELRRSQCQRVLCYSYAYEGLGDCDGSFDARRRRTDTGAGTGIERRESVALSMLTIRALEIQWRISQ